MLSGSYRTGSFVKPVTPVMIEYNSKQNLNSFPDGHHIKNGIQGIYFFIFLTFIYI